MANKGGFTGHHHHQRTQTTQFSSSSDSDTSSSEDEDFVVSAAPTTSTTTMTQRRPSGLPPPPPRKKSSVSVPSAIDATSSGNTNRETFGDFSFDRGAAAVAAEEEEKEEQKEQKEQKEKNTSGTAASAPPTAQGSTTFPTTAAKMTHMSTVAGVASKTKAAVDRLSTLRRIRAAREKKRDQRLSKTSPPPSPKSSIATTTAAATGTLVQSPVSSAVSPAVLNPESSSSSATSDPTTAASTTITPSTTTAPTITTSSPPKKKSKRQRVLQEIVETEKTFVTNLSGFYHGYVESIRLCDTPLKREIMGTHEIALLFSNLEQIVDLNTDMLKRLQIVIKSWDEKVGGQGGDGARECVGDFFCSVAPLFALYAQYTSNHDLAVDVMKSRFEGRSEYLTLMKICESVSQIEIEKRTGKTRLPQLVGFYLIMPVQRVPRYKMLLQELFKRTNEGHSDLQTLPKAIAEVNKSAHLINETIRAREEKQRLVKLSTQFALGTGSDVNLVATGRTLLHEGSLIKVCRRDLREYYFHLFSDIMTYSKKRGTKENNNETFKLHRRLELLATDVVDVDDETASKNKVKHAFQIVSQQKSFMVSAPTLESKKQWIDLLKKANIKAREREVRKSIGGTHGERSGMSAAMWAADGTQNQCTFCSNKFTVIKRRHHCRKCGSLVCASCSPHRLLLRNIDPLHTVRVCNGCAYDIEKRLRHSLRVEFQIHQLIPCDESITTELFYVKVFENDTYVGTTENSHTGSHDCPVDGTEDSFGTFQTKKTGTLTWKANTSTFDFEIDHLSRGTDDAGKPHRIYLEMYSRGFNTTDTLVGVGSISAMDILCCTENLYHPSPSSNNAHVQRRLSISEVGTRRKSFDLKTKSNNDITTTTSIVSSGSSGSTTSDGVLSSSETLSDPPSGTLMSTAHRNDRRNSLTNVVPNTPLVYSGSRRNMAMQASMLEHSSTKPAALVKMIQTSNIAAAAATTTATTTATSTSDNDTDIHVMGELAVSAVISTPLEMRKSDHGIENVIQEIMTTLLPAEIMLQMDWGEEEVAADEEKEATTAKTVAVPTTEMMASHHVAYLLLALGVDLLPTNEYLKNNLGVLQHSNTTVVQSLQVNTKHVRVCLSNVSIVVTIYLSFFFFPDMARAYSNASWW